MATDGSILEVMHQSDNRDIAVLQEQMTTLKTDVGEIKSDVKDIIKTLEDNFVKRSEFQQYKWFATPATIIITAVITSLVYFYFANRPVTKTATPTTTSSSSTQSTTTTPATTPTSTTSASNSSTPGASVTVPLPTVK